VKSPVFDLYDRQAMAKALDLARSVKGATGDNPAVGAVVYKKGAILGMGRTHMPGQDHAEAEALWRAGKSARGASLAVTLEPCCIHGRTSPCTHAIIASGIKRVVAALKDPNPLIHGRGLLALARAGVRIECGLGESEAMVINEDFFKYITTGIPFVVVKAGLTLNGLIAADSRHSRWITSEEARQLVHELRARTNAVLVGLSTVLEDNPKLTVRHVEGRNPIRVVLSHGPDIPKTSYLAKTASDIRTIVVTPRALRTRCSNAIQYIDLGARTSRLPIRQVLRRLGVAGIKSVLVEGGSEIYTSFLEQRCIDMFQLFFAPRVLSSGIPFVHGQRTLSVRESLNLRDVTIRQLQNGFMVTARPER